MLYLTKYFMNEYETETVMLINLSKNVLIKSHGKSRDGSN